MIYISRNHTCCLVRLNLYFFFSALDGSPAWGPISPDAGKYLGKQGQTPAVQPVQKFERLQEKPNVPQQAITESPKRYEFTTLSTLRPACAGCGIVTSPKPGQPFQFQNPAFQKPPITSTVNGPPSSGLRPSSVAVGTSALPVGPSPNVVGSPLASQEPFAPAVFPAQPTPGQLFVSGTVPAEPPSQINKNVLSTGSVSAGPGIFSGNQGSQYYPSQQQNVQPQQNIPIGPGQLPPDVELLPPGATASSNLPGGQNQYNNLQQKGQIQQIGYQNNGPTANQILQGPEQGQ